MLHHSQSFNIVSPSKKIRKQVKKPSTPQAHSHSFKSSPSTALTLDPIKAPFFSNFLYYPSSVKANIMRINRKPIANDLDHLVKDLAYSREFCSMDNLRNLAQDQEKMISSFVKIISPIELRTPQKQQPQTNFIRKFELKVETKPLPSLEGSSNDSDEFIKEFFAKKENSFYDSSISTTPSKKNSPLFNERKNLLLSSQIENILSDNYDLFVKKFDEESLNLGSIEEEDQAMFFEWEEKERFEREGGIFKGIEIDRSFFSHDKEFQNYF